MYCPLLLSFHFSQCVWNKQLYSTYVFSVIINQSKINIYGLKFVNKKFNLIIKVHYNELKCITKMIIVTL